MTTVITYGTFDLYHIGHVKLLQRLKGLGSKLVVGLSTDEFNQLKGKQVVIPFKDRLEILMSCKYVDHVFAENSWEQKEGDIKRENASIFAMGDDWAGKFDYLESVVNVVYLPRTKDISTTDLKTVLRKVNEEKLNEVKHVTEHLAGLIKGL